jgi:hypothetical protein
LSALNEGRRAFVITDGAAKIIAGSKSHNEGAKLSPQWDEVPTDRDTLRARI